MRMRFLKRDIRGSIAVTTALCMPVLFGFVALGVDVGSVYLAEKRLQGATDLAALSAAGVEADATEATVARILLQNGFPGAGFAIERGAFSADRARDAGDRFAPSPAGGNALRVRATVATPLYFARLFRSDDVGLEASAVAAVKARASFSIASRLASLEGGVLNQLVSQALGPSVTLSVLDTDRLAAASIDGGGLATALAQISPQPTYGALFGQTLDAKLFLAALSAAARERGNLVAASILNRLVNQTAVGTLRVEPSALISIPDISDIAVGSPTRALDLDLNLLDMVTATALSKAQRTPLTIELKVPPLAAVSVAILIGEGEQPSIAAAPVGTRIATAQVKARVSADLLATGPLAALARIRLPLEIVVAAGEATLDDVVCRGAARGAMLGVRTGAAKIEIGGWGSQPLAEASLARLPKPATLVSILGITATARSVVQVAEPRPKPVAFASRDVETGAVKTVDTRHVARSLAADLVGNLGTIDVSILGLPLIPKSLVQSALLQQIGAVAAPLDIVLGSVLDIAGLGIGESDVRVGDVSCGAPTIVG